MVHDPDHFDDIVNDSILDVEWFQNRTPYGPRLTPGTSADLWLVGQYEDPAFQIPRKLVRFFLTKFLISVVEDY